MVIDPSPPPLSAALDLRLGVEQVEAEEGAVQEGDDGDSRDLDLAKSFFKA